MKFSRSCPIVVVILHGLQKNNKITFMFCVQHNQGTGGYSSFKVTAEYNISNILHYEINTSGTT